MEFTYDGGGLGKGGDVTLFVGGEKAGDGRVEFTQAMIFSADEITDVGYDSGTPVASDYTVATSRFTGRIGWVQIDLGVDDHDHLVAPNGCASRWPASSDVDGIHPKQVMTNAW